MSKNIFVGSLAWATTSEGLEQAFAANPYGNFRMGVQSYSFRDFSFAEAMQKVIDLGLHHVELYSGHLSHNEVTPESLEEAKNAADLVSVSYKTQKAVVDTREAMQSDSIHEGIVGGASGQASDIEIRAKEIVRIKRELTEIYVKHNSKDKTFDDFDKAMDRLVENIHKNYAGWSSRVEYSSGAERVDITIKPGRKFIKIIRDNSVWGFVVIDDGMHMGFPIVRGDVLKAAGWRAPARHTRGNIFDRCQDYFSWTGPNYL